MNKRTINTYECKGMYKIKPLSETDGLIGSTHKNY